MYMVEAWPRCTQSVRKRPVPVHSTGSVLSGARLRPPPLLQGGFSSPLTTTVSPSLHRGVQGTAMCGEFLLSSTAGLDL